MNKITVLYSIHHLAPYLTTGIITNNIFQYRDKIFIREKTLYNKYNDFPRHTVRIWKSNSIFDLWYDGMDQNFIAALDYEVRDDNFVKIEYINVNDEERAAYLNNGAPTTPEFINDETAKEIEKNLITYTENIARENSKTKLVLDVHGNLRLFNKYYKDCGFVITERKSEGNNYWIEVEKFI